MMETEHTITLVSNDEQEFTISRTAANKSVTIKELAEDIGDVEAAVIPLPEIRGVALERVVTYLKRHANDPEDLDEEAKKAQQATHEKWDAEFIGPTQFGWSASYDESGVRQLTPHAAEQAVIDQMRKIGDAAETVKQLEAQGVTLRGNYCGKRNDEDHWTEERVNKCITQDDETKAGPQETPEAKTEAKGEPKKPKTDDVDEDLVDTEAVCELILAANYLSCRGLLDLAGKFACHRCRQKTPQEIKEYWKLTQPWSEEEETYVRNNTEWLID